MMETRTYKTIDRSHWPDGQWNDEPDKVQWQDETTKLPCLAVRHPRSGHWCGYVGVAQGHPCFQLGYEDVDVAVHGGLTFADICKPEGNEAEDICHVPGDGEPHKVWWFGFDCAHCDDLSYFTEPRMREFRLMDGVYRTLEYVQEECRQLAAQLISKEGRE